MATFSSNYSAILSLTGGGAANLATTLGVGNTTGGSDIVFSGASGAVFNVVTGASPGIDAEDNAAGAGADLNYTGSDAGGGNFDGGDLNFTAGLAAGTGTNGVINFNSDVVFGGSVSLTNLLSGTLSPEGAVAAAVSTIFQRTDGGAGNSLYVKMGGGVGMNGWAPMGPRVVENFVSPGGIGIPFTTGRAVFDDTVSLGIDNITVFWNGVLQRQDQGAPGSDDYAVVFGGASATVTFTVDPPATDLVTICYLPA